MVLGQFDIHMQENEVGPPPHANYTKINQQTINLIKLLQEYIGLSIYDLGFVSGSLAIIPRA
jgi:hypothetical protein